VIGSPSFLEQVRELATDIINQSGIQHLRSSAFRKRSTPSEPLRDGGSNWYADEECEFRRCAERTLTFTVGRAANVGARQTPASQSAEVRKKSAERSYVLNICQRLQTVNLQGHCRVALNHRRSATRWNRFLICSSPL
jgi:hypothetical protein